MASCTVEWLITRRPSIPLVSRASMIVPLGHTFAVVDSCALTTVSVLDDLAVHLTTSINPAPDRVSITYSLPDTGEGKLAPVTTTMEVSPVPIPAEIVDAALFL